MAAAAGAAKVLLKPGATFTADTPSTFSSRSKLQKSTFTTHYSRSQILKQQGAVTRRCGCSSLVSASAKKEEGFGLTGTGKPIDSLTINDEKSSTRAQIPNQPQSSSEGELAEATGGRFRAVVVGAGPAGAFMAILLAANGFSVDVFEKEARSRRLNEGSLNVVLTERGVKALRAANLEEAVRAIGVNEKGQLAVAGQKASSYRPYKHDALSVGVADLARLLVEEGERRYPATIAYHFGWRLESGRLDTNEAWLTRHTQRVGLGAGVDTWQLHPDLLIGADGTDSKVRKLMEAQVKGFKAKLECEPAGRFVRVEVPPHLRVPNGRSRYTPRSKKGPAKVLLGEDVVFLFRGPRWVSARPSSGGVWSLCFTGLKRNVPARVASEVEENFPELAELFSPTSSAARALAEAPETKQCSLRATAYHYHQAVVIGDAAHAIRNHLPLAGDFALEDCVLLASLLKDFLAGVRETTEANGAEKRKGPAIVAAVAAFTEERKTDMDPVVGLSEELVEERGSWSILKANVMGMLHKVYPKLRPWQNSLYLSSTPLHKVPAWRVQEDIGVGAILGVAGLVTLAVAVRVARLVVLKK